MADLIAIGYDDMTTALEAMDEVQRLQDQFGDARRVYSAADLGEIVFSNAASGISRSVWRDEPFTLPAVEDIEWAGRVVSAGWTIVYEPEAAVYHSHAESARAQARRLIDIGRVADGEDALRGNRRTLREACGFVYRNFKAIFALDEALRQKLFHLVYVLRVACYYVLDFSRSGTTAERRREDARPSAGVGSKADGDVPPDGPMSTSP